MTTIIDREHVGERRIAHQRETRDGHAFEISRWEECVQMPGKMFRSGPQLPFDLPEMTLAVSNPPILLEGRKSANIKAS
jgi:hypothetical protein